jgi:hypothetical protein
MGADHQRRVIGYFTGWRTGKDGTPAYLASDIPWDKVTHINYAFGHIDSANRLSVGADGANNAATGGFPSAAPGASVELDFVYYLPTSTPSNWTVTFGGKTYGIAGDLGRGTTVVEPGTGTSPSPSSSPSADPTGPGNPGTCTAPAWSATTEYSNPTTVSHKSHNWKSKWWTKGEEPGTTGEWGVWQDLGAC